MTADDATMLDVFQSWVAVAQPLLDAGLLRDATQQDAVAAVQALVDERPLLLNVATAANELLDGDRTSWSDYHAALADGLAELGLDLSGE